jgi:CheY-like chemotaxis protein
MAAMAPTILIVDDSSSDAELLQATLLKAWLHNPIRTLPSAREAMAYIQGLGPYADRQVHPEPGIILVDLQLPGMDGIELLDWLREYSASLPILSFLFCGSHDFTVVRRGLAAGAASFLTKPFTVQDVESLVVNFPGPWARAAVPPFLSNPPERSKK